MSLGFWNTLAIPIPQGRMRGMFWAPASGGKILRVLLGSYEREQTELFAKLVGPGSTVLDIGAHVGYYTLLAARLMRGQGKVVAFEPDPKNAAFLRRHVSANRAAKTIVDVQQAAVGATSGSVRFSTGTGSGTGHVSADGPMEVRMIKLDDFVSAQGLKPTHVKIDVEGAELDVLQGGRETLRRHRPVLFLSTHGTEPHAACCRLLAELDYKLEPILGGDVQSTSELLCRPLSSYSSRSA